MRGMIKPNSGMSLASIGLGLALCAGGVSSVRADWTVINLHPVGMTNSEAHAIYGAQQVGVTGATQGALLWTGSAGSVVKLDGTSAAGAADAVWDGHQAGSLSVGAGVNRRTHAVMWSGTQASMIDLHPGADVAVHSMIVGMDGTQQVGSFLSAATGGGGTFSTGSPCMWSGTAGSFVNLTPAGISTGEARGCFGGQQVGATFDTGLGTACMWYGTAESFVNLQPDDALFSAAQCTDGVHQYGVIGILAPITGLFPVRWSGTAASWELLDIPDTSTQWGEVHACFNGYAVGYTTDNDGISHSRACVWSDGPHSFADLQQYLPSPLNESNALGVWRHAASGTTYVVGWGLNTNTNQRQAIMWVDSQGTNLIVSPKAPADDSASAGQSMVYNLHITNAGPVASGAVTMTVDLPAPWLATFASATPAPSSTTSSRVTFTLPSIAGSGGSTDVSVTLTAAGGGTATIVASATAAGEVDPTNNTASASSHIAGPAACIADIGMQGGLPGHDGQLDNNDFIAFISAFFANNATADVGRQGGLIGPDGQFDNNDFIAFITLFFTGCP